MLHVVLYEPEIPPNTGNVMRLCANAGVRLHLIEPLGFRLDDKELRRAGLDYGEWAEVKTHSNLARFVSTVAPDRLLAFSTRGNTRYSEVSYRQGDALLFGPETRGLPKELIQDLPKAHCLRLPLVPGNRSMNLSNAVAVVVYEAWRQLGFPGGE